MPWLGGLADACCGKVIWLMHATARRTTWNILRQGEPGRFCSEWVSNVVFYERVTIPYISDSDMTWCFLRGFFRCECFFRLRCLGIATFGTFFGQNERMRGGRFRVRVGASSSPLFLQRRTAVFLQRRIAVFSAICMTLLFG